MTLAALAILILAPLSGGAFLMARRPLLAPRISLIALFAGIGWLALIVPLALHGQR